MYYCTKQQKTKSAEIQNRYVSKMYSICNSLWMFLDRTEFSLHSAEHFHEMLIPLFHSIKTAIFFSKKRLESITTHPDLDNHMISKQHMKTHMQRNVQFEYLIVTIISYFHFMHLLGKLLDAWFPLSISFHGRRSILSIHFRPFGPRIPTLTRERRDQTVAKTPTFPVCLHFHGKPVTKNKLGDRKKMKKWRWRNSRDLKQRSDQKQCSWGVASHAWLSFFSRFF